MTDDALCLEEGHGASATGQTAKLQRKNSFILVTIATNAKLQRKDRLFKGFVSVRAFMYSDRCSHLTDKKVGACLFTKWMVSLWRSAWEYR